MFGLMRPRIMRINGDNKDDRNHLEEVAGRSWGGCRKPTSSDLFAVIRVIRGLIPFL
jgi:hypothetical protein